MLRGKWWEIYNDPELNALEEQLNINNQNIKQSFENFMAARAIVRQARAQFFPTVSTAPSLIAFAKLRPTSAARTTGGTGSPPRRCTSTLIDLPARRHLGARSLGQDPQYRAPGTVLCPAQRRRPGKRTPHRAGQPGDLLLPAPRAGCPPADSRQRRSPPTRSRSSSPALNYETGISDQIAVVQAQTTLESAQSLATNLGVARAQYEHAIATLIGKPASEFSIPVQAAAHYASAHSGRPALAASRAPSGHRRRRAHHGRRQRPDRHRLRRLLSQPDALGYRRL